MKSKKLVVFLVILIFLAVLIVLNSTLFTLQSVSINWLTTKYELETIKDSSMISSVKKGDSIFLLNKDEIKSSLEKKYPYLRVVKIETKFPNKIVIHSAERESMFAVKLSDNEYAVIDERGKVLSLSTSSIFAGSELSAKPIQVYFSSMSIDPADYVKGEIINNETIVNLFTQISRSLRESDYIPTTSKRNIVSIDVVSVGESVEIYFQTRNGLRIVLKDGLEHTTDKFILGLDRYNYFHQEGVISGDIVVWEDALGDQIFARYEEIEKGN